MGLVNLQVVVHLVHLVVGLCTMDGLVVVLLVALNLAIHPDVQVVVLALLVVHAHCLEAWTCSRYVWP